MTESALETPAAKGKEQDPIDALVLEKLPEIDLVLANKDPEQLKAAALQYGVDHVALAKGPYKYLQEKYDLLRSQYAEGQKKVTVAGYVSAGASLAFLALQSFRKKISPNPLVQVAATVIGTVTAGIAGRFFATVLFLWGLEDKSKVLTDEAGDALKRELAVAIKNKEIDEAALSSPVGVNPSGAPSANVAPRDASYAAQRASELAAAQAADRPRA